MDDAKLFFQELSEHEVAQVKALAVRQDVAKDHLIFSEGELGDTLYIIEKGEVSVFFTKGGEQAPLCTLGVGEFFGEMCIVNRDRRSASVKALEDSTLLCVGVEAFNSLVQAQPALVGKLDQLISARNEELILRETLIDTTGIQGKHLYVSIKGDPSMRESALFRDRYESPVDKILAPLSLVLIKLLKDYCTCQLMINFNSGEIRARSVFDPFRESVHTSGRLLDPAYVERHFNRMDYFEKIELIKKIQQFTMAQPQFLNVTEAKRNIFSKSADHWEPLPKDDVGRLISKLAELREIPHFYLRNFSISLAQDAIRMQFNCDGTHIVSSGDYDTFLETNFGI